MAKNAKGATELKAVEQCIADIAPIMSRLGMLGGKEADKALSLKRRLEAVLSPVDVPALIAEARTFIAPCTAMIEKGQRQARETEEAQAKHSAERSAMRAAHAKAHADAVEAERQRKAKQIEAIENRGHIEAVDEVLGRGDY
jgi:hypothetical protein